MIFGWRPQTAQNVIATAPIPLYYNYGNLTIPANPQTGQAPAPIYLGPRIPTTLQVHKLFANREIATSCETKTVERGFPSYAAQIPAKISTK